jgi:signal transduction histidine kinase/HAMP domain-containing protein
LTVPRRPLTFAVVMPRRRLFLKYVVVFVGLVSGALLASGAVEIYFSYRESTAALVALQREKAAAAAMQIEAFVREIERQIGWTTQPQVVTAPGAIEQRRVDFLRLQRQVPPITELTYLDGGGKEQLRVSRLAMDVAGSGADYSGDPRFREASGGRTYFGPVYFRKESEPYMSIAMPQSGGKGVVVAEVNLKFIWDVVSRITIGKAGHAYVVDSTGVLVAHPDISLVLQKTTMTSLPQVGAALAGGEPVTMARDLRDRRVLTAHAMIPSLRWHVFAEQPLQEAFASLRASIERSIVLIMLGVLASVMASMLLARRMVQPIRALQEGAAKIGAGELGHRLRLKTGDEIEVLAEQFNRMTEQLRDSYATLEQRVEERTRDLRESLEQQTSTSEILRAINSSLVDIQPVFDAIARSAVRLTDAAFGGVTRYDGQLIHLVSGEKLPPGLERLFPVEPRGLLRRMLEERRIVQSADVRLDPRAEYRDMAAAMGYRTLAAVPMLREGVAIGGVVVLRTDERAFSDKHLALLRTFADQAVIAIENVRLFAEIQQKSRELEAANQHKSAFLANMSHELRTPLNAILGYTELIRDGIYGEVPEKIGEILERVDKSGRHLLGLINDVLDLSKIEAGHLRLALDDFSIKEVAHGVFASVEALAAERHLGLGLDVAPDVGLVHGDERRITQVLLNLVGNAIKFTPAGEVRIEVRQVDGLVRVAVIDSGPGIAAEDHERIFREFEQADTSSTRTKGGTGLGLSIARRIVELHGGRIGVESEPGHGSTFWFTLPLRAA